METILVQKNEDIELLANFLTENNEYKIFFGKNKIGDNILDDIKLEITKNTTIIILIKVEKRIVRVFWFYGYEREKRYLKFSILLQGITLKSVIKRIIVFYKIFQKSLDLEFIGFEIRDNNTKVIAIFIKFIKNNVAFNRVSQRDEKQIFIFKCKDVIEYLNKRGSDPVLTL